MRIANMMNSVKESLIEQLATGQFISGQALGDKLGISRSAVSKHIAGLASMGLDVYRVTGKGYRIAEPLVLLNSTTIQQAMLTNYYPPIIEVKSMLDSTNDYVLQKISQPLQQGQVCLAEHQKAGRGRRGRQWVSPFGSHVYLSMYWYLEQGMSAAMGLSVVAALAVSDAIKSLYHINVSLKWPNDIYIDGKKLAGVLIDLEGQALEPCHSVIGLGINVNMPQVSAEVIDQPWTDLQTHCQQKIDRNILTAKLIDCLLVRLIEHREQGITNMLTDWQKADSFLDKKVRLITGVKETLGWCRGINSQGALLLEVNGAIKVIYGGEVSLREAS
jgi:BirA family biotin operon repressor/biotin-[acetyl-CoA-carboxylase] ligase